jgi:hypothetical protein
VILLALVRLECDFEALQNVGPLAGASRSTSAAGFARDASVLDVGRDALAGTIGKHGIALFDLDHRVAPAAMFFLSFLIAGARRRADGRLYRAFFGSGLIVLFAASDKIILSRWSPSNSFVIWRRWRNAGTSAVPPRPAR